MRVGLPTGTHMCRSSEEAHSLLGLRVCAYVRDKRFHKTLIHLMKHLLGFISCKL
jgi:hypothetical protein